MNTLKKFAFQYVTPVLCVLSLSTATVDAQNCCPQDPCCPDWGCILIPVLAGAAAGAGVAAAMDHRGKRGKRGHRGSKGTDGKNGTNGTNGQNGQDGLDGLDGQDGKNGRRGPRGHRGERGCQGERGHRGERGHQGEPGDPFVADVGETLTFDFALTLQTGLSGASGDIIPFVEAPDGRVIEATHFDPFSTSTQTADVTINNPLFGTYHFGYFIPAHSNGSGILAAVDNAVETSRDNTLTAYIYTTTIPSPLSADIQITDDFTYFINDEFGG